MENSYERPKDQKKKKKETNLISKQLRHPSKDK